MYDLLNYIICFAPSPESLTENLNCFSYDYFIDQCHWSTGKVFQSIKGIVSCTLQNKKHLEI